MLAVIVMTLVPVQPTQCRVDTATVGAAVVAAAVGGIVAGATVADPVGAIFGDAKLAAASWLTTLGTAVTGGFPFPPGAMIVAPEVVKYEVIRGKAVANVQAVVGVRVKAAPMLP